MENATGLEIPDPVSKFLHHSVNETLDRIDILFAIYKDIVSNISNTTTRTTDLTEPIVLYISMYSASCDKMHFMFNSIQKSENCSYNCFLTFVSSFLQWEELTRKHGFVQCGDMAVRFPFLYVLLCLK